MNNSVRGLICAAGVTLSGVAMGTQTMLPSGTAQADVCTQVGNNATVTTCADMSDIVLQIVTPGRPDRQVGNLTPNLQACLGWDGIWVYADSCT
jgi:hypothetical protein